MVLTEEQKAIVKRCRAWAYKLARTDCHVIFHKLPKRRLGECWSGFWKLPKFGMRTFKHNVIIFDLEKIHKGGYDVEGTIIHECMHLKFPRTKGNHHPNEFAVEMKQHVGCLEWGRATQKSQEGNDGT